MACRNRGRDKGRWRQALGSGVEYRVEGQVQGQRRVEGLILSLISSVSLILSL